MTDTPIETISAENDDAVEATPPGPPPPPPMPRRRYAASMSLVLGALAATGFAPLDLWPVALACLAAWLWLVHDAPTMRTALFRGWAFGVGHFTVGNNWIQHAFTFQDAMPHWLGYLAVVLLALYLAVYPMLAAGLAWRFASTRSVGDATTPPGAGFVLVSGAAWIATEWLRATMFTGYAWNPLGVVWLPLIGVARSAAWIGTYALSGLTIVVAGAVLMLVYRHWRFAAPVLAIIAILAVANLQFNSATTATPNPTAPRVRIVQPDLGQEERPQDDYAEQNLRALQALSGKPGPAPRLIVWPEGAVRLLLEDGYPESYYWRGNAFVNRIRIASLLGRDDVVLTGGTALQFDRRGDLASASNAVFAIDQRAELLGRYDKAHLVPYGEYLPMRPLLSAIGLSRLVPGDIDFADGPGPQALDLPKFGKVGVQICYEIIFSGQIIDPAHRPSLLFNPSNDSWFGAWGPPQHLAQARLRAIEEGLPIVRATPTGISAIIDADGRLLASIPQHRAGAIEQVIPPAHPATLFAQIGNMMALIMVAALLLMAVAIRRLAR